ncbi:MAG: SUMF1/EgtB/PvdO family nonheme iron enzyme [Prosthecobacter sp.]|nr:SUMF1/EgtB/PvdO family nonheme iron enzyme [Prosthecobacter sp.]
MSLSLAVISISVAFIATLTAGEPVVKTNGNPAGMVWIPGGTFSMGCELEGSRLNEKPVVKASVDGFWLDEHDVTNSEFRSFVEATGYKTTAERAVDWEELKKQVAPGTPKPPDEMLRPGSLVFIPTEGPVDLRLAGSSPVKTYPPNGYGLSDMGGNVWNWVSDFYRPDTRARQKLEPSCHNPTGPKSSYNPAHPDEPVERVTKGGSFLCHANYCESYRPAARRGTPPDTGMSHIGFRCALSEAPRQQPTQDKAP